MKSFWLACCLLVATSLLTPADASTVRSSAARSAAVAGSSSKATRKPAQEVVAEAPAETPAAPVRIRSVASGSLGIVAMLAALGLSVSGVVSGIAVLVGAALLTILVSYLLRRQRVSASEEKRSGRQRRSTDRMDGERRHGVKRRPTASTGGNPSTEQAGNTRKAPKSHEWNTRFDMNARTVQPMQREVRGSLPPGFDEAGFLRSARYYFIRLQSAWDRSDLNDLREFCAPELIEQFRVQIMGRGAAHCRTEIVTLEAELVSAKLGGSEYVVNVRFLGILRVDQGPVPKPFNELWAMRKPVYGEKGWTLSAIFQPEAVA